MPEIKEDYTSSLLFSFLPAMSLNPEEVAERYKTPNLIRAMAILELIGQNNTSGMSMADIVKELGYPQNSVLRISMSLMELGFLSRKNDSKRFFLTKKLLGLGTLAIGEDSLIENSIDIMRELRDIVGESVLLGVLIDDHLVVLEQVLGSRPFKFSIDLGAPVKVHTSAPGKAIAAYLPPQEQAKLLDIIPYTKYTKTTITTKQRMQKELSAIQERGYSEDQGEELTGVHCLGAPIFNISGYPIASIWTTGPAEMLPLSQFGDFGKTVVAYALKISRRFGYRTLES